MSETQTAQSRNEEWSKRKHALTRVYATVSSKEEFYAFMHVACGGPMWDNFGKIASAPARQYIHRTEDGNTGSTAHRKFPIPRRIKPQKTNSLVARMQVSQFKGTGLESEIRVWRICPHILTF
jgi:hypothetical protein